MFSIAALDADQAISHPRAMAPRATKSKSAEGKAHFKPALFTFMRELAKNNNRDWFLANKERFESDVQRPLLSFIIDVKPHLEKISKHIVADARPTGGSMFRIYRDTRFAKDKTPYKTAAAAQFRHDAGKDVHAPGYYLHLEPGSVFFGGGIWRPDPASAGKIRDAIVARESQWRKIVKDKNFPKLSSGHAGESLKRPPAGFDPEHPFIEDIKRKDFIIGGETSEKEACSPEFLDRFVAFCKAGAPWMDFMATAVGHEF